jgi:hypothetical protein
MFFLRSSRLIFLKFLARGKPGVKIPIIYNPLWPGGKAG